MTTVINLRRNAFTKLEKKTIDICVREKGNAYWQQNEADDGGQYIMVYDKHTYDVIAHIGVLQRGGFFVDHHKKGYMEFTNVSLMCAAAKAASKLRRYANKLYDLTGARTA